MTGAGAEPELRRFTVAAAAAPERLDVLLRRWVPERTRAALQGLVRQGRVTVGGETERKPSRKLKPGEQVEVELPPEPRLVLAAEARDLAILFEDDELLVLDKPAGLVVHPAAGHRGGTLVNALLGRAQPLAAGDDPSKPGIVHRLDKDTSGCLIVAKTARARAGLEEQFRARSVKKTYLALVHGRPPASGRVTAALGRDPRARVRMAVRAQGGKPAESSFKVLERFPGAALLEVEIRTGRTHQIRVHLASLGHPVVGDELYGHGTGRRGPVPLRRCPRQALHAWAIGFHHPVTGAALRFRAPLPIELEELLQALRGLSTDDDTAIRA